MKDEITRILDTNVEDLTKEDKTTIGMVAGGIAAIAGLTALGVFFIWRKKMVRRLVAEYEQSIQSPTE